MAMLSRVARRASRDIVIHESDTVIISASAIPGNETVISNVIDNLTRQGAHVVTRRDAHVHVQGHASQEELKLMLNLIKPKYFVPIHGEYRMLAAHARLAESVGVTRENIFVMEDGHVLEVSEYSAEVVEHLPAGHVFVDGLRLWDMRAEIFKDRRSLSRDGFVVVVVPLDHATGELLGDAEIASSGFIDMEESVELIERAMDRVSDSLRSTENGPLDEASISARVRKVLGSFLYEETGRRPMIVPLQIEV